MRRLAAVAACALLAACTTGPLVMGVVDPESVGAAGATAEAGSCTHRLRASLPIVIAGLPTVTATINGHPARLILDTGAETSIISLAAAKRLGVTSQYDFSRSMTGVSQTVTTGDARLDSMSLGAASLSYPRVLVGSIPGVGADGLLGASLLNAFDLDIDLPNRRLDLYDRVDCSTAVPPWTGRFTTVETTRSLSDHPFFPVQVGSRTLSASLDSGAQRSVIASAAKLADVNAETRVPGTEMRVRGAAGEVLPAELHALRNVRVGDIPIRTPILVTPLALPRDIDMLLGADFLQTHRVWLSYGSRRLFIQS